MGLYEQIEPYINMVFNNNWIYYLLGGIVIFGLAMVMGWI